MSVALATRSKPDSAAATGPFFDYPAFERTPLVAEPFAHLVVPGFVRPALLPAINRDYPAIGRPGNVPVEELHGGPTFEAMVEEMRSDAMRDRFAHKFGVDLSGTWPHTAARARCEPTDGNIHTDHKSKLVTVLFYFNEAWDADGGRLRLLRSQNDMESHFAEVVPAGGTMLAFLRTDHSWHGHKPFVGERRFIQMSYTRGGELARKVSRLTKPVRRLLNLS